MSESASPPAEHGLQRLLSLTDACVLCGLCLPHCPTYRLEARESESPRGRVLVAQALARDPASIDASGIEALEHCLGCGRCEQVCPAKVRFGDLMRLARRHLPLRSRSLRVNTLLWASRHPDAAASLLRAVRPLRALLPRRSRRALAACAKTGSAREPSESTASFHATAAPETRRVGLLLGCVARTMEAWALDAAARLLRACGHSVLIPDGQACCGALDQHAGSGAQAEALHEQNRRLWSGLAPDVLVGITSGCQAAHAAALSALAPVTDVASLLVDDAAFATLELRRIERRVALHLPCTQRADARSVRATRELLARIPGLDLVELPDTGCCGAGGAHMLQFADRAERLRRPLLDAAIACGATTLLSANLGCRLHLGGAAELAGVELRHPLELLAEALP
ncbi:(Fe-S)-binding protein [Aquimonas voraii]|uniref:Glycolate oxidase iron-sulfur subunit n=1 Tax=Aquimonas voraii TaxID=265719 RepID=A0A1G6Y884_9GAMM|nr:(Fe-S)-binding protein [Aquimonas voraii]SDD86471.1 glycolate oxidase iron-sulfur subunit [Aquimonas voraii]